MKARTDFNRERAFLLDAAFPLTLTLSLGERGQPLDHGLKLAGLRAEGSRGNS